MIPSVNLHNALTTPTPVDNSIQPQKSHFLAESLTAAQQSTKTLEVPGNKTLEVPGTEFKKHFPAPSTSAVKTKHFNTNEGSKSTIRGLDVVSTLKLQSSKV